MENQESSLEEEELWLPSFQKYGQYPKNKGEKFSERSNSSTKCAIDWKIMRKNAAGIFFFISRAIPTSPRIAAPVVPSTNSQSVLEPLTLRTIMSSLNETACKTLQIFSTWPLRRILQTAPHLGHFRTSCQYSIWRQMKRNFDNATGSSLEHGSHSHLLRNKLSRDYISRDSYRSCRSPLRQLTVPSRSI